MSLLSTVSSHRERYITVREQKNRKKSSGETVKARRKVYFTIGDYVNHTEQKVGGGRFTKRLRKSNATILND